MKHNIYAILLISFLLEACLFSGGKTAGTEDFPNTVSATVFSGIDESKEWKQFENLNTELPQNSIKASDASPLAKSSSAESNLLAAPQEMQNSSPNFASAEDFIVDTSYWVDDGEQIIHVIEKSNSTHYAVDSIFAYVGNSGDSLISRVHSAQYSNLGNLLTLETLIEDYDGNNHLSPIEGEANQAIITSINYKLLGQDIVIMIADAGADLDFGENENSATEDNLILEITGLNINADGDTLKFFQQTDADGDGFITPSPGRENRVNNQEIKQDIILKTKTHSQITVDAGEDDDFGENGNSAEADNLIIHFEVAVINQQGDTISHVYTKDLDGDNIITAIAGNETNSASYHKILQSANQRIEETVELTAGKDNDFDLEFDNQIISYSKIWTNDQDTLLYARIADADGDGIAFDSLSDSSIVDVYHLTTGIPPRKETKTTMVVFPEDSTKNYPIYGEVVSSWNPKKYKTLKIFGKLENDRIDLKDTVFISVETAQDDPSFTPFQSSLFKAGLGEDIYSDEDNVLYSFEFQRENPNQEFRSVEFSFISEEPIPNGEEPKVGSVEARLETGPDESYSFVGLLVDGELSGQLTLPDGSIKDVNWKP